MEGTAERRQHDVVRDYLACTTFHGVQEFGRTYYPRRRNTWLTCVVIMAVSLLACAAYHCYRFGSYPSITKIDSRTTTAMPFPAVTICSLNQFKFGLYPLEVEAMFRALSEEKVLLPKKSPDSLKERNATPGDEYMQIIEDKLHTPSVRHCTWQGRECPETPMTTMTEFGHCKTYNSNSTEKWITTKAGSGGGFRIIVDIQQKDYFISRTIQLGVKVILHEPGETPFPETHGFIIGPGKSVVATIRRFEEVNLERPYLSLTGGYCVNTRERGFVNPLKRYDTYTKDSCLKECYLDRIEELCGCRRFFDSGNASLCSTVEIECHVENSDKVNTDGCQCDSPCFQSWYEYSLSYADMASFYMAEFITKNGFANNRSYIRNNILDVRIYYDRLMTHVTEQIEEMTLMDFLGNLGGIMGLFLGASLLSVIQLIEFLCILTWKCIYPRGRASTSRKTVKPAGECTEGENI